MYQYFSILNLKTPGLQVGEVPRGVRTRNSGVSCWWSTLAF